MTDNGAVCASIEEIIDSFKKQDLERTRLLLELPEDKFEGKEFAENMLEVSKGVEYFKLNEHFHALECFEKIPKFVEECNNFIFKVHIAMMSYHCKAIKLSFDGQPEEAYKFMDECVKTFSNFAVLDSYYKTKEIASRIYLKMIEASIHEKKAEYEKAKECFHEAYKMQDDLMNSIDLNDPVNIIGVIEIYLTRVYPDLIYSLNELTLLDVSLAKGRMKRISKDLVELESYVKKSPDNKISNIATGTIKMAGVLNEVVDIIEHIIIRRKSKSKKIKKKMKQALDLIIESGNDYIKSGIIGEPYLRHNKALEEIVNRVISIGNTPIADWGRYGGIIYFVAQTLLLILASLFYESKSGDLWKVAFLTIPMALITGYGLSAIKHFKEIKEYFLPPK